jgi:hypothetical protein
MPTTEKMRLKQEWLYEHTVQTGIPQDKYLSVIHIVPFSLKRAAQGEFRNHPLVHILAWEGDALLL